MFLKCRIIKLSLGIVFISFFASCAAPTLKPEDCYLGAWYAVGADDGRNGRSDQILRRHKNACAKYDIDIDAQEYMRGYTDGNKTYCDAYHHYGAGVLGETHLEVCDREPYISTHAEGIEVFCQNTDHFEVGSRGERFQTICPAFPYKEQYLLGVAEYCQKTNPYVLARQRGNYHYICDASFDRGYALGIESLRYDRKLAEIDDELGRLLHALVNEKDSAQADSFRVQIEQKEQQRKTLRIDLLKLKLQVRDLGYLTSDDLLEDLIEFGLIAI